MEGVDINLDVSVGQQLSALGHTLTMLTGSEEEDDIHIPPDYDSDDADQPDNSTSQVKKKVWFACDFYFSRFTCKFFITSK